MASPAVPFEFRLLWGFLAREGMRTDEALSLAWSDLDLARGAVRLDKNKTDDPRSWALQPGVATALRAYRERFRPTAQPTDLVFVRPDGSRHIDDGNVGTASMLRRHLRVIGLDQERPELFTTTAERKRIRAHDLRGTFVTVALANGRSESWISDRTGHRSSQMIATYKRTARMFTELQLGDLAPLDRAIPELGFPQDYPTPPTSGDDGEQEPGDPEVPSAFTLPPRVQIPLRAPSSRVNRHRVQNGAGPGPSLPAGQLFERPARLPA